MEIDINKNKASFIALVKAYVKRDGIDALMQSLEESEFFTQHRHRLVSTARLTAACVLIPLLLANSLWLWLTSMLRAFTAKNPWSSLRFFHDLCKTRHVQARHPQCEKRGG